MTTITLTPAANAHTQNPTAVRLAITRDGDDVGLLLYTGIDGISTWNLYEATHPGYQAIPGASYASQEEAEAAAHARWDNFAPVTTLDAQITAVNAYADWQETVYITQYNRQFPARDRAAVALRNAAVAVIEGTLDWTEVETLTDGSVILQAPEGALVRYSTAGGISRLARYSTAPEPKTTAPAVTTLYHATIEYDRTRHVMHTVALYREGDLTCEVQSVRDQDRWYTLPVSYVVLGAQVEPPDALIEAEKSDVEWEYRKGEGWRALYTPAC